MFPNEDESSKGNTTNKNEKTNKNKDNLMVKTVVDVR